MFLRGLPFLGLILSVSSLSFGAGPNYWEGVQRTLPSTALGQVVGVSCHNCYGSTLNRTREKISKALSRDFDFIELDLSYQGDGSIRIEHDPSDDASRPFLSDVFQLPDLRASDRPLFLEIKEDYDTAVSATMMRKILRLLRDHGLAHKGRPAALRAFMRADARSPHQHLIRAGQILREAEFATIRDHIRFHGFGETGGDISLAKSLGFHAIELPYTKAGLYELIRNARRLQLGVGLFTTPANLGEVFLAQFREDVDFITTDYDLGSTPQARSARDLLVDDNSLFHLNTTMQTSFPLSYYRQNDQPLSLAAEPGSPDLVSGRLVFRGSQSLTTYDADNTSTGGYLVSASARFDALDLGPGSTRSLVAKSDAGGFALELYRESAAAAPILRFGVRVGQAYHYATMSTQGWKLDDSFQLLGAYDGDGRVRLWVNGREGVPSAVIFGAVVPNNSPIVIGADPQGNKGRRFHFKGQIQQVTIQSSY